MCGDDNENYRKKTILEWIAINKKINPISKS